MTKQNNEITFGAPEGHDGSYRDIKRNGVTIGLLKRSTHQGFPRWTAEICNPSTRRRVSFRRDTIKAAQAVITQYAASAFRTFDLTNPARTRCARITSRLLGQHVEAQFVRIDERPTNGHHVVTAHICANYGTGDTPSEALADLEANLTEKLENSRCASCGKKAPLFDAGALGDEPGDLACAICLGGHRR